MICTGGGNETSLKLHLRRITGSKSIEIPEDKFRPVIEASYDLEQRRDIMQHLRECLSEQSGKRWLRSFTALVLVERVMQRGDRALVTELARGHHFDLLQKVSFLEQFDAQARGIADERVQVIMRNKACAIRAMLMR